MATLARAPVAGLPDVQMSQSSVLMASLIGGFVVYLMMNQKLATYWSILIGGSSSGTTPAATSTTGSTSTAPAASTATSGNATPLTTPAPGTGSGGIGSA